VSESSYRNKRKRDNECAKKSKLTMEWEFAMGGAQSGAGCFENEWRHQHKDAIWGIGQLYYFYIYIYFVFFLTCPHVTC